MKSSKRLKSTVIKKTKFGSSSGNSATPKIIVAKWKKNRSEIVRVMLQLFRGTATISIRTWYRDARGRRRPGKHGINLPIEGHLPKLSKAIRKARKLAENFPCTASSVTTRAMR
jgi:hypothetical protein